MSDTRTFHRQRDPLSTTQALTGQGDTRSALPAEIDGDAIYRRTGSGEKAVEQSSRRVSMAAQRALNLFDGSRPLRDLPRVVSVEDLPAVLKELLDGGLIEQVGSESQAANDPHPDMALAQIKRALAGAFVRELGPAGSVLDARVQDCVNLVVLKNVLEELTGLIAKRKNQKAADRIRVIGRRHGL